MHKRSFQNCSVVSLFALFICSVASAGVLGTVRGVVHDPQHRPISNAQVELRAARSEFKLTTQSDANGGFEFPPVEIGEYLITVNAQGFASSAQMIHLASGSAPILHFPMQLAAVQQT